MSNSAGQSAEMWNQLSTLYLILKCRFHILSLHNRILFRTVSSTDHSHLSTETSTEANLWIRGRENKKITPEQYSATE